MAISQVDSGFEPEIFKSAFKDGWQNYEYVQKIELEDSEEESKLDITQDFSVSSPRRRLTAIDSSFDHLLPESMWF